MTERERLVKQLTILFRERDDKGPAKALANIATTYILEDRRRIVEPLIKWKNDRYVASNVAINEALKLAALEVDNG